MLKARVIRVLARVERLSCVINALESANFECSRW